jgi:branched-chain amino acid aminotransferase
MSSLHNKTDKLFGTFYLAENKLFKCAEANYLFDTTSFQLYEVLRSANGSLIFLEDHLSRLNQGIKSLGLIKTYNEHELKKELNDFLHANKDRLGNVKILCSVGTNKLRFAAYFTQHSYPEEKIYSEGVKVVTYAIERPDPQIKQIRINNFIRQKIEDIIQSTAAYEVLLVDNENCLTEGSKSNFFLVKGDTIYSAPSETILAGITRKYVLSIAKEKGIKTEYKNLPLKDLDKFEAAFLCGTSPKILPIKEINNITLDVKNAIIDLIKAEYNTIIQEYINRNNA